MSIRNLIRAVIYLLAIAGGSTWAQAVDFSSSAFVSGDTATSTPVGHYEFCRIARAECGTNGQLVRATILTPANWGQLIAINIEVNATITPVTDQDQYGVLELWTYPAGAGDCEDYVLAKRRALIEGGWSPSTLLMTVVRQRSGEGHAVLLVRTDRGDLVLDNQDGDIHVWNETPYRYLKRQSQADAGQWVEINDDRVELMASAH